MTHRERRTTLALLVALVAACGGGIVWVVASNQAIDHRAARATAPAPRRVAEASGA
jgi:ferric-dicitrate binding protein FerR (iron transport regulator)